MSDHDSRPQPDNVDDAWLAKLYNEDSGATPPASLDAAILAEAHAKKFSPATGRRPWQRWSAPALASAAAVLLTVGLFVSQPAFRQGAELAETAAPQADMQLHDTYSVVHSEVLPDQKDADLARFDVAPAQPAAAREDREVALKVASDMGPARPPPVSIAKFEAPAALVSGEAELSVGKLSQQSGNRSALAQLKARREQHATATAAPPAEAPTESLYTLTPLACETAPCPSEVSHPECPQAFALSALAADIVIEAGAIAFTVQDQRRLLTCSQQVWQTNITSD